MQDIADQAEEYYASSKSPPSLSEQLLILNVLAFSNARTEDVVNRKFEALSAALLDEFAARPSTKQSRKQDVADAVRRAITVVKVYG